MKNACPRQVFIVKKYVLIMRSRLLIIPLILHAPALALTTPDSTPLPSDAPAAQVQSIKLDQLPMNGGLSYGELFDMANKGNFNANMILGTAWMETLISPDNLKNSYQPPVALHNMVRFFSQAAKTGHPAPKLLMTDPGGLFGIFKGAPMLPEHAKWLNDCRKQASKGDLDAVPALRYVTELSNEELLKYLKPLKLKAEKGDQAVLSAMAKIREKWLNEDKAANLKSLEIYNHKAKTELLYCIGALEMAQIENAPDAEQADCWKKRAVQTLTPAADSGHAGAMQLLRSVQDTPLPAYEQQLIERRDINFITKSALNNKECPALSPEAMALLMPTAYHPAKAPEQKSSPPSAEQAELLKLEALALLEQAADRSVLFFNKPYELPLKQLALLPPYAKTYRELMLAAQLGDEESCVQLGEMWREKFRNSSDSEVKNKAARRNMKKWFAKAAEEDHPLAKLRLAQQQSPNSYSELPKAELEDALLEECKDYAADTADFITLRAIAEYLRWNEWNKLTQGLRTKAQANDAQAQANLAYLLLFSAAANDSTYAEGLRWARLSAMQDNPCGMYALGRALVDGFGLHNHLQKGWMWLFKAALSGHVPATLKWAEFTSLMPQPDNPVLQGLAMRGHTPTLLYLARYAAYPPPAQEEPATDENAQGNPNANDEPKADDSTPPWLTADGKEIINAPTTLNPEAIKLWSEAASLGSMTALDEMAAYYEILAQAEIDHVKRQKLRTLALTAVTVLVQKEDMRGLMRMANYYKHGIGVQANKDMYREYLLRAADVGEPHALVEKARMLLKGVGLEQDYKAALSILLQLEHKQTDEPLEELYFLLGYMHDEGLGTERDHDKAFNYYKEGAEKNDAKAINNLAYMYENGVTSAPDLMKAKELYEKAANLGNEDAKINLEKLKERLKTPKEEK